MPRVLACCYYVRVPPCSKVYGYRRTVGVGSKSSCRDVDESGRTHMLGNMHSA